MSCPPGGRSLDGVKCECNRGLTRLLLNMTLKTLCSPRLLRMAALTLVFIILTKREDEAIEKQVRR